MKFYRATVAIALAATLALGGCAASPAGPDAAGGENATLTLANPLEPVSFDPAQALDGDPVQYFQAVYDSLIRRLPNGEYAPMLATAWSYNADNTVLSLELRDDVTFTDGVPFDAEAVKANLEHFKTAGGMLTSWLNRMVSADVTGEHSIDIVLSEPEPALITYLSLAAGLMGSPDAIGTDDIKTMPIGTGPYTLDADATSIGSQYTFVKNEDYWNPDIQYYDRIVIKPMADATARVNALVSGQIDATRLEPKQMSQVEAAGLVPHLQELDWYGFTIFDRSGELVPALADPRVRQAINLAVDKEKILETIFLDTGTPTSQIFGPGSSGYVEALEDAYTYDPEKAKELIEESGFTDITIELPVLTTSDPALTAVVVEQLAAVGITLAIKEIPPADLASEILPGKYPMFMWSMGQSTTWLMIRNYIAEDATLNLRHSADPVIAELIAQIQGADESEAEATAKELNEYLVEQAWFAPWFRVEIPYYSNADVEVTLQADQAIPYIWNYKPKR